MRVARQWGRDSNRSDVNDLRTTFFPIIRNHSNPSNWLTHSLIVIRCKVRLPRVSIFHIIGACAFCAATTALEVAGNQKYHEDSKACGHNTSDEDTRQRRASKVDAIKLNEVRKDIARTHPDLLETVALRALMFR
jgi:hypothetical protein